MSKRRPSGQRLGRTLKRPAGVEVHADSLSWTRPWVEPGARVLIPFLYLPVLGAVAYLLWHTTPGGAVPPHVRTTVSAAAWLFVQLATWVAVAAAVNRTTVRLAGGWLTLTHHPLFWPGGRRYRAADIEDVTVGEFRWSQEDGPDQYAYEVRVRVRGDFARPLIKGISEQSDAEYFRQRLLAALPEQRRTGSD